MLCGYGGAVSDAIIISCKEEIICQQEAEKLFRQTKREQMRMKASSEYGAAVHEMPQLQRSQLQRSLLKSNGTSPEMERRARRGREK